MAKKTAKPNFDCVVVNSDDNAYFSFNGYGVSRRQFEAYVEKVKTKFSDIETDDSDIKYFEDHEQTYRFYKVNDWSF